MVKILTIRRQIREYITACRGDSPSSDQRHADYLGKRKAVASLDENSASADDIERIVGTQGGYGWGRLYDCDECKKSGVCLVEFEGGETMGGEPSVVFVCPSCLQAALNSAAVQVVLEADRSREREIDPKGK